MHVDKLLDAGQGERYWLRLLLTTVKGSRSYDDVATVDGYLHGSFQEAAIVLGLVADDDEQDKMLQAASLAWFSSQMRALFAEVLVWHEPLEPAKLWAKWVDEMAADYLYCDQHVHSSFCLACTMQLAAQPKSASPD